MITFEVNDMTCGRCVSAITQAVKAVDAGAQMEVNLAARRVSVDSAAADPRSLQEAIAKAGYTAVPTVAEATRSPAPRTGGCCCGSGSGAAGRCG